MSFFEIQNLQLSSEIHLKNTKTAHSLISQTHKGNALDW